MTRIYSIFLFFLVMKAYAQEIAVGQWNVHVPYKNTIAVAESDHKIYCGGENALFYYDLNDNSISTLSKASGLSDVGISTIAYSKEYEILIIAYSNGNIDLIENDKIINLSDIKRKSMVGAKNIYKIAIINNEAWMACSFGIVVLDIASKNFLGNWTIGPNGTNIEVMDLTTDNQYMYASTADGVYRADLNSPNIQDYNYWFKLSGLPSGMYNAICFFENKVYANYHTSAQYGDTLYEYDGVSWSYATSLENMGPTQIDRRESIRLTNDKLVISSFAFVTVYGDSGLIEFSSANYGTGKDIRDGLYSKNGYIWLADNGYGLIRSGPQGGYEVIAPSGPRTSNVFDMAIEENVLWAAPGGVSPTWSNSYIKDGIFFYKESEWGDINKDKVSSGALDTIVDYLAVAIDPSNPNHAFVGSWDDGVLEFTTSDFVTVYSYSNSTLMHPPNQDCNSYCRNQIADLNFDANTNLWVANTGASDPLSVRLSTAEWKSFSCDNLVGIDKFMTHILCDPYNQKWVSIQDGGVLVFNENQTYDDESDDFAKILNTSVGNGALHTNSVTCIAIDRDSAIWLGTNEGPCIISSPSYVFSGLDFDSYRPQVWYDSHYEWLLQNEYITDIAVDGANRKWIATETSGAYLVSEDGSEQILHFDEENSPLLSNNIRSIAINQITGEVFFGTDKGIVSYKGDATEGTLTYDNVLVYPNPVREDFAGTIAIRGLVTNSVVRITDITGNLIYQTIAEGGQANWNGNNFKGDRAQTGVYLVLCVSPDGTEKFVTKIAFVN